ncbi:MAG: ECF transporter S component [Clostridia bacterium]|nr:ECF transporter S component [Clostridia bacterium]
MKALSFENVVKKSLVTAIAVTVAVALPWLCHLLGGQFGWGTGLGEMLLPMHLPVMLAGIFGGPAVGLLCGVASPLISAALTGMPLPAVLPFMMVELAVYGLTAGLLRRNHLPTFVNVLLVQVAGRFVRAVVLAVAVYGFGFDHLPISLIWTSIAAGLAGIFIQWAVLPPVWRRIRP